VGYDAAEEILREVMADAVAVEPVSTSKFPANREKNSEFFATNFANVQA